MTQLVSYLKASGAISSEFVAETMMKVDRVLFCNVEHATDAYADNPLPIECDQTISAPHIHAMSLECLKDQVLTPHARVLDVGSGSGYVSACYAIMNPSASVFGIEMHEQLVKSSIKKVGKLPEGAPQNLVLQQADGWDGLLKEGPFHAINVGAAAVTIPARLANSLALGGRMLIPVGPQRGKQQMLVVDRIAGLPTKLGDGQDASSVSDRMDPNDFRVEEMVDVAFVPLVRTKR